MTDHQAHLDKILRFLSMDVTNLHLLAEAADLTLAAGRFDDARELVERLLRLKPEDQVGRYQMAVILLQAGDAEGALAFTQPLIDAGLAQPALCYTHARGLLKMGRFVEAEPLLAQLLPLGEEFPGAPHLYIRTLHSLGRMEEALAFTANHLRVHPGDDVAKGMGSLLYLDQDDLARAHELAMAVLQTSPDNLDALLTAGTAALAQEDGQQAKAHFDKVLALHGDQGRAWVGMGMLHLQNANLAQAEQALLKAVACMPGHLGSQNALSWAQILQRDYAGARRTLEASLQVDRNFAETHGTLAVVEALEQRYADATRLAELALRLDPQSFAARYAQSLVIAQTGDPARAQAMLASLIDTMQTPNGGSLREMLQRVTRLR